MERIKADLRKDEQAAAAAAKRRGTVGVPVEGTIARPSLTVDANIVPRRVFTFEHVEIDSPQPGGGLPFASQPSLLKHEAELRAAVILTSYPHFRFSCLGRYCHV